MYEYFHSVDVNKTLILSKNSVDAVEGRGGRQPPFILGVNPHGVEAGDEQLGGLVVPGLIGVSLLLVGPL